MTPTLWSLALVVATAARVLVLPFENTGEERDDDWKGSALEEAVAVHLGAAGLELVELEARNRALRERGLAPGEPVTRATAILLARELEADRLVVGTFRQTDQRLEATVRVLDLTKGSTIGVIEDFAPVEALATLGNQLAKNVFRLEGDTLPAGFDALAARRAEIHPEALRATARARLISDPKEIRRLLERALSFAPDCVEARVRLGRLMLEAGEARAAIAVLAATAENGPTPEAAYFDLGLAYLRVGDPESARQIFSNLTTQRKFAADFNNLGVALVRIRRMDEASEAFRAAIENGGEKALYLFNLGWSYWRAGKGAEALECFRKLTELHPLDAEAHLLHSAAAFSQAEHEEAERKRAVALMLAPRLADVDPGTVEGWGRPASKSGEQEGLFEGSSVEEPEEDVVALVELFDARALRSRGRLDEAIQLLSRSLYREPGAVEIRRELAELYREVGQLQKAASELSVLLWSEPSAETHLELARIYLELEDPEKAYQQVEQALALDPDHAEARLLRGELQPESP